MPENEMSPSAPGLEDAPAEIHNHLKLDITCLLAHAEELRDAAYVLEIEP